MSRDHYKGIPKRRKVVARSDGSLDLDAIVRPKFSDPTPVDGLVHDTRLEHQIIVDAATAEYGLYGGVTAPDVTVSGALLYLAFTGATDAAFRVFRIGSDYVSDPSFHIQWTKTDDADRSGTFSKWCIEYSVFDGEAQDATPTTIVETAELEYLDSGTTSRIVYKSPSVDLTNFVAGHHVAVKVTKLTTSGTEMPNPGLVAMDLVYRASINLGN